MKKAIVILTSLVLFGFGSTLKGQKTIVDVAASNSDFSTLVAAIKAADLVDALQGDGPFTVFAPTNSAFAKIDSGTLNSLLEEENKDQLSGILTYHVVAGEIKANDVVSALKVGSGETEVKTLNGQTLEIVQKNGKIWLKDGNGNFSEIIKTDITTSNGVIHVIDTVVMPKAKKHHYSSQRKSSCH